MGTRSKYYPLLSPLLGQPSFSTVEAKLLGVPSRMLSHFVDLGLLERLDRGVYRSTSYEPDVPFHLEGLVTAASTIPNGIICLVSALDIYHFTDEVPREHWIAIPHTQRIRNRERVRIVRMRNTTLGRDKIQIGHHRLTIFNRERCVVDAFRYLSLEVAIKALRAYLEDRDHKPDLQKLARYAKTLRVKIRPYILALTT